MYRCRCREIFPSQGGIHIAAPQERGEEEREDEEEGEFLRRGIERHRHRRTDKTVTVEGERGV